MSFHINKKGDVGKCSVTTGTCPFGDESTHYTSIEAARHAVEKKYSTESVAERLDENRKIDTSIRLLTNSAADFEADEFEIKGIDSWAVIRVNGESDLVMAIARLSNGEIRADINYGPESLLIDHRPLNTIFNEADFIYFLGDCDNFEASCRESKCDKWGESNCLEHSDSVGAKEAWKVIEKQVLPRYLNQ